MTNDEIKELRKLYELIDAFQKRPVKDMAACADVAEAGQRMSKMLWEKLPAILTAAERVRELEAEATAERETTSSWCMALQKLGQEVSLPGDPLPSVADAALARIRDLEAQLARAQPVIEAARRVVDIDCSEHSWIVPLEDALAALDAHDKEG